jgi:hypothetical protein
MWRLRAPSSQKGAFPSILLHHPKPTTIGDTVIERETLPALQFDVEDRSTVEPLLAVARLAATWH